MSLNSSAGLKKLEDPGKKLQGLTVFDVQRPSRRMITSPTAAGEAAKNGVDLISGLPLPKPEEAAKYDSSISAKKVSRDVTGKVSADSLSSAERHDSQFHKKKLNLDGDNSKEPHDPVTGAPLRVTPKSSTHKQKFGFETTMRVNPITGEPI
mmetsp:Transcript_24052/g.39530  ORF Transcript_24052/g.39530 Transcript_24052/m.39530 type:complete len:152 (-) Transcript_24052:335-790(-)|eukprot:CAMPEP_0184643420 /NCGR_PEP_ID=MMETSP0308-20130426/263_1 /TAXON_ID=38269 /ORGANISM="Gloeochaete witrockiana, Strain SAG 46.84" /LENGTH=151 /DNA_ID=CAMNT_0027071349 /DNA_START=164 /DNA_END=619 /DNA_ORIENTATION=+